MLVTHRSPTLLLGKSRCAVRGLESASARFRSSSTRGPSRCRCGCRRQRRSHSVVARGDGRLIETPRLRPQRLKPQAPSNCRSGAFSATSPNILFRLLRAASPARSMPRSDAAYRAENATGGSPRVIRRGTSRSQTRRRPKPLGYAGVLRRPWPSGPALPAGTTGSPWIHIASAPPQQRRSGTRRRRESPARQVRCLPHLPLVGRRVPWVSPPGTCHHGASIVGRRALVAVPSGTLGGYRP